MPPVSGQGSVSASGPERRDVLDKLLRESRGTIEGYIRPRARSRDDADDLIQNVLLKAARHFDDFRNDCPFSQWLLRIAVNEVKNYYRRLSGEKAEPLEEFDIENSAGLQQYSRDACPDHDAVDRLVAERILAAIETHCSADERNVILMVYQGESFEEAAELLGMKSATARSHFLRGRSKLLAHLFAREPDMVGGPAAIQSAISRAGCCQDARERLQAHEAEALATPNESSAAFRAACLKVARHLDLLILPLAALGGLWNP